MQTRQMEAITSLRRRVVIDGSVAPTMTSDYIERLHESPIDVVNWTVCRPWSSYHEAVDEIGYGLTVLDEHSDRFMLVKSVTDIATAVESGRVGVIFGPQNALPAEGSEYALRVLYELGVRIMQLTYNEANSFGAGVTAEDNGLSPAGRKLVEEMARLGIVVDVSHCGDRTTLDAIETSPHPILVTHANLRSIHPSPRNKTDEAVRALAERGGVIGVTLWSPMLRFDERPGVDDFLRQLSYAVDLVGIEHVGIGSDFSEGADRASWDQEFGSNGKYPTITGRLGSWYGYDTRFAAGGSSASDFPAIIEAISSLGFTDDEMQALLGGNFLRVFEEVWK
ncbi:MAG TPA: membrane dipeptidase [Acidimicrobiia bacterium]